MTTATEERIGYAPRCARSGEPIRLAMQRLWLTGRLLPVGAHLFVHHAFRSQEQNPLEVIYSFALPRDAALRRFFVRGEGLSVRSELKPVADAVRVYEEGLARGHLATLARQYRDGMVNLTLGNLRPGETVIVSLELLAGVESHDDGWRFRFPFTLAPCYHPQARVVEYEPGVGEMELPEEEFADLILPQWRMDACSLHEVGFHLAVEAPAEIAETSSPSHAVRLRIPSPRLARVRLARESDVPDRDLVLDVRLRERYEGVLAGTGSDGRGRFAAVIPSTRFGEAPRGARRVVFVLDRSGSMSGKPIAQAKRACEACLAALNPEDEFGFVAFDNEVEIFREGLTKADAEARDEARTFLARVDARGGTGLAAGIERGAAMLRGGGDLFLITDGQVFGTEDILARVRAAGVRVHCLGIGSASQDRFLNLLARQTGGASRFLTPRERVDVAAVELFAAAGRPVAERLEVHTQGLAGGRVAPAPPPAVFRGTPLVVFGDADGPGQGSLEISWCSDGDSRKLSLPLEIGTGRIGEALRLLQGARLITDLESRWAPALAGWRARRTASQLGNALRALSEAYGLASREMALVAVVERAGDQPGVIPETRVVPVGMPEDTEFEVYFYRPAESLRWVCQPARLPRGGRRHLGMADRPLMERVGHVLPPEPEDQLLDLACRLEPDGGMPGIDPGARALSSLLALLAFLEAGHTEWEGAFRLQVQRLVEFLQNATLPISHKVIVEAVLARMRQGRPVPGDWLREARLPYPAPELWDRIAEALAEPDQSRL